MDKRKIILLLLLSLFVVGMLCGTAAASHTYKCGKYKVTVSDKQYKKLKKAKKKGGYYDVTVKTDHYKTYKTPKYKTVTKKKWKYIKVLESKDVWSADGNDFTTYDYSLNKYYKNGWKWYGSTTVKSDDGNVYKYYSKLKKKVPVKEKVKNGYKKKKVPIYAVLDSDGCYSLYDKYDYYLGSGDYKV